MKYYIIFSNDTTLWYLKALKKGFRHLALLSEEGVLIDPLASRMEIRRVNVESFLEHCRKMGTTIVETTEDGTERRGWGFGIFTCVEVAKRILNLKAPTAITPYGLWKRLVSCHPNSAISKQATTAPEEVAGWREDARADVDVPKYEVPTSS